MPDPGDRHDPRTRRRRRLRARRSLRPEDRGRDAPGWGIPIGRLGVTLGLSEASALVQLLGLARARALVLGGRLVDTDEALRIGLLDSVTSADLLSGQERPSLPPSSQRLRRRPLRSANRALAARRPRSDPRRRTGPSPKKPLPRSTKAPDLKEGVEAFRAQRGFLAVRRGGRA